MNIKRTVRVEIDPNEMQKIIADYVGEKVDMDIDPKNVEFSLGTRTEGYGPMEYSVNYFKGCTVTYTCSD